MHMILLVVLVATGGLMFFMGFERGLDWACIVFGVIGVPLAYLWYALVGWNNVSTPKTKKGDKP